MLKPLAVTVAVLLLICIFTPSLSRSAGVPHAIIGNVTDLDGKKVLGALVWVNNTATGDSLSTESDYLGRYSVDIDSYPNGYSSGQVLIITAVYDIFRASGNITVNTEPVQQLGDLVLAYRNHIISGYVLKPNGQAAIHYAANVLNMDTSESRNFTTDSYGFYRGDIGLYPAGFSVSDNICVSVDVQGFYGSNYAAATANQTDWVNISLADVQAPAISLSEAPASLTIGEQHRIIAYAVDNLAISWVKLCMKKPGQTIFTQYQMHVDDGITYDWNGDNWLTPSLFGISTSDTLPSQIVPGIAEYYFEVSDSIFTVTLPATDPQGNPFEISIIDATLPTISHTPITQMESAQPRAVSAALTDNVAISTAVLHYRQSLAPTFTQAQMLPTGNPNEYGATIPAQMYLGYLEYYIWCNDTSNNIVTSPAAGYHTVAVTDTTAPSIIHTFINSEHVWTPINFTCQVSDPWLSDVWINFTDVHGAQLNFTMQAGGGSEWYHLNSTGQDNTGTLFYTIWAEDTSGNIARRSHAMAITDNTTPKITHIPVEYIAFNTSHAVNAYVTDDVDVPADQVNLSYKPVGGTIFTKIPMTTSDTDAMHKNFTAAIPPQGIGTLEYFINATDSFGNSIHWPAVSPSYPIEVLDRVPPVLSGLNYSDYCPANVPVAIRVNATDNDRVGTVSLMWLNSTGAAWSQLAMADVGSGVYEALFPAHKPDTVRFYFFASDPSGNNVTLPALQPKLNPYRIEFFNTTIPEIFIDARTTVGVNRTSEAYIHVIDNREGARAEFSFKGTEDAAFRAIQPALLQNGTFYCTIPAQNRSGTAQYFVTVRDNSIIYNQTQVNNMSIINALPVITHVPVPFAPVGENVALVAMVTDDLRVENVTLNWKLEGQTQFASAPMEKIAADLFSADISQGQPATIQYFVTACDAEGQSRFPALLELEISVTDLEAPVIVHSPISNISANEMPIIIANVTDNWQVSGVSLFFKNSTAQSFSEHAMSRASGSDDYVALLGIQPEGEFSYYIEATDSVNTAWSPESGAHRTFVEPADTSSWISHLLLAVLFILIAAALLLVLVRFRRKPIKEEAVSPDKKVDSDENAG